MENKETNIFTPEQAEGMLSLWSSGKATINDLRKRAGLEPINCEEADCYYITLERCHSNVYK